ncbi:MAG: uracil-DNA glycosylase [Cyanobacteria bacterium NC_groundwater_1444_Ag_S-0.65um_54_12]|nr:uracil-DNA glycosylase [Cyanobacteria bacterium NC_groundwater_1444_Ag_S-0.65um_54_12]
MPPVVTVDPKIEDSWKQALTEEFSKEYFLRLKEFLLAERKAGQVFYPPGSLIFNAFACTPFHEVKIVLLGQDPYHGKGQAHGLCFSVPERVSLPPSLVNIFKELASDLQIPDPRHGNLEKWARQGVLLLNATLTVRANQAGSHQNKGWEDFTDAVIYSLSCQRTGIIFVLWGKYAKGKASLIDASKHHILMAAHPSPFSAHHGFFGCRHFSRINHLLTQMGKPAIVWALD